MSRPNGKAPPKEKKRFVAVRHWVMDTPAWQSLSPLAVAIYIEISRRYRGTNNGNIPYAVREAEKRFKVGHATVIRALQELKDRGFIVEVNPLDRRERGTRAARWRITEFDCNVTGELATDCFMRWTPSPAPPRPRPRPSLRVRYG